MSSTMTCSDLVGASSVIGQVVSHGCQLENIIFYLVIMLTNFVAHRDYKEHIYYRIS